MATNGATGEHLTDRSPDATRGASPLRSADWRFLVPLPPDARFRHLVLLGGRAGRVERAVSLDLGEVVTSRLPGRREADAVVAYHDAPETVAQIAGAVARDGVLYLEIDRRRRGRRTQTLRAVTAALARASLSVAAVYAVEPDFTEPRAFVPLDSRPALTWYRRMFFRADGALARLTELVRYQAVLRAGRRGAGLLRRFAVVAVGRDRGDALPGVLLDSDVQRMVDATRRPTSAVLLAHGGDRVLLFPFTERVPAPLAVVKVPKAPAFFGRTENEQSRLHDLRARLDPRLAAALPAPKGVIRIGSALVACEALLPGRGLSARAGSPKVPFDEKLDDLRRATEWLVRFHRATEVRRMPWSDEIRGSLIDEPMRAYALEFGTTRDEAALFARASGAAALRGVELPIVCQHRDFAVWNLLRDGDALSVVDWEGAREGPALCDALHLATTWLCAIRMACAHDEGHCLHDIVLGGSTRDGAAAAARAAIDSYMRGMALDRRLLPLLTVHHRVELALRRRDQQRLQNEMGDNAASEIAGAHADLRAVRVLAAATDRLFALGGEAA